MNTNLRRIGGWLLCVPVAALGLTACGEPRSAGSAAPLTAGASASTSAAPATKAEDTDQSSGSDRDSDSGSSGGSGSDSDSDSGSDSGSGSGSGSGSHGSGGSGGSGGGSSQPSAKVVSLTVTQQPSCPVYGTTDAPYSSPGNDVVISWKVSGADGAAIGVDNPNTYGAYGSDYAVSGTESFAFGCGSGAGSTSHKFTVWPKGHPEISKTITVSARNNP
jgi:hypothetical protein